MSVKSARAILLMMLMVVAGGASAGVGSDEMKIKTSAICNMCKKRIERNVSLSKGIKEAVLDVPSKVLTVKYNGKKTTPAEIKKLVSSIGYDADEVPAVQEAHDKLPSCCKKTAKPHLD